MNRFITNSDFVGDKFIPLGQNDITLFNQTITVYQKRILLDLLGWDLYLAFEAGLAEDPIPAKWSNLKDGDSSAYEVSFNGEDHSIKYEGMSEMLIYLIWFYYMRDLARKMAYSGKVLPKNENSQVVIADDEMVRNHNKGIELYGYDWANLQTQIGFAVKDLNLVKNRRCVSNYKDAHLNNEALKIQSNVYNYIYFKNDSDSTIYPKWVFTRKRDINTFGI